MTFLPHAHFDSVWLSSQTKSKQIMVLQTKVCERIMPMQLLHILVYPVTILKVLPTEETLFPVEPLLIKELSTLYTN
jgi:hypothetical protein